MKPKKAPETGGSLSKGGGGARTDFLGPSSAFDTLADWLQFAEELYAREGLAVGQVATNAHDEALYLILRTLGLPLDSDPAVLEKRLTSAEKTALDRMLRLRVGKRIPAAYLTKEAFLGEHRFYVDERVIIPRSYFLEVIPSLRLRAAKPRVADVCTGSGCLAILLAHQFPWAKVDAIDLSADALAVAAINVKAHRMSARVKLHESDVFDAVPLVRYDLILSNPPYEPSGHVDDLPAEFRREPRLALDGGPDGLDIIRKLLRQARSRLATNGRVLIEVGGLRKAMDREFAALKLQWLSTADGADCVCAIGAARLRAWSG